MGDYTKIFSDPSNYSPSTRAKRYLSHPLKSANIFFRTRLARWFGLPALRFVTATTFFGEKMKVILPHGHPEYLWGYMDGEELNLTKFIMDNVKEGQCALDVGAHFGFYTLLLSRQVGTTGRVFGFEPTPRTMNIVQENVADKKNVSLIPLALSDHPGEADFIDFGPESAAFNSLKDISYEWADSGSRKVIRVQVSTLDEFCAEQGIVPNFIKIDAEGVELKILQGGRETLRHKPILSVEMRGSEEGSGNSAAITSFLKEFGYAPYSFRQGELVPYEGGSGYYWNTIFK